MRIRAVGDKLIESGIATVEMGSGDMLSAAFMDGNGGRRVVTLHVQGRVMVVTDEHTGASMVARPGTTQYVQGK